MAFLTFEDDQQAQDKENQFLAAQDEQLASKSTNLLSVDRGIQSDKQYLQDIGEVPPPEPGRGWLPSLLDTLDTPHQWVEGIAAKLSGVPEYRDLGILDAAQKGSGEDLRTADILRRTDTVSNPALRGALGFLGDVALDPLQWITAHSQMPGVGGAPFAEEKIPTLTSSTGETPAEMFQRIKGARFQTLLGETRKENPNNDPELSQLLSLQADQKAESEAAQLFEGAQSYQRDLKSFQRSGISNLAPEEIQASLADKATRLGVGSADPTKLGLASVEDFPKLHKRPTLRYTSPFIGIPGVEQLPIIGTREGDIPIVSEAVANARDALSDGYYGAKLKVRNWVADSLAEDTGGADAGDARKAIAGALNWTGGKVDSLARYANGLLTPFSRRITATGSLTGERLPSNQIAQNERDRDATLLFSQAKSAIAARDILNFDDRDDIMRQITRSLDEASSLFTEGTIAKPEQQMAIRQALAKRIADPTKLAAAQKFTGYLQSEYQRMAQKEQFYGLLDNAKDIYFPHIFDLDGQTTNFAMQRKYSSLQQAAQTGLKPNEDAMHLLTARRFAHELAFAQKDFAERMAFQWGLDPRVYGAVTEMSRGNVQADRAKSLAALRQIGIVNNKDLQIPAWTHASGRVVDGDGFDTMADMAHNGDAATSAYHTMMEESLPMRTQADGTVVDPKVFFNPDNRAIAEALANRHNMTQQSIPGYDGESTFARAGAETVAPFMRQKMLNNIAPGDELFWNNLIPSPLAHALEESYYVGDSLKRYVEKNKSNLAKNGYVRALDGSLGFLGNFNKVLKQGALSIWPARYARDLVSAGFQSGLVSSPIEQVVAAAKNLSQPGMEAARGLAGFADRNLGTDLGKYLNYHSATQAHEVINGGKDLATVNGPIPNRQLMTDAIKAGFEWNGNYSTDLASSMNDMMHELASSPGMSSLVPNARKYIKGDANPTAIQKGVGWLADRAGVPMEDRFWQKFPDFAERLERYGRTSTFINLRQRGFNTDEAASLSNRMHIDYKNAKTPFERDFLNKMFFFYSFSRGNASALMTSLMKKPGALTTQLHAFHAVGEMLKDPSNYVEDPDIEEKVRSTRLAESMSMYLGTNPETNLPRFLAGSGLPVEDLSKFGSVSVPTAFSAREVIRAGADTLKRTGALLASQANPLIRTAAEFITGRNLFYDRPITDETLRKVPKWEKDSSILGRYPFRAVPNEVWSGLDTATKEVLDAKDNGDGTYTVNPYNLAILTTVLPGLTSLAPGNPVVGALSPLKYASRFLNTRKMLTEPGVSDRDKWLRALTGVHVDEIDPDASRMYDEKKEIGDYMDFIGVPKGQRRRLQMLEAETEGNEE